MRLLSSCFTLSSKSLASLNMSNEHKLGCLRRQSATLDYFYSVLNVTYRAVAVTYVDITTAPFIAFLFNLRHSVFFLVFLLPWGTTQPTQLHAILKTKIEYKSNEIVKEEYFFVGGCVVIRCTCNVTRSSTGINNVPLVPTVIGYWDYW